MSFPNNRHKPVASWNPPPNPDTNRVAWHCCSGCTSWRDELQSGESASLADAAVATHEVSDQKDAADRRQASSIDEAVQRHEQSEVELVLAALRRLDEGRYGNCQDCDEPISPQRLQVQPAALRLPRVKPRGSAAHLRCTRHPEPRVARHPDAMETSAAAEVARAAAPGRRVGFRTVPQ